MKIMLDTNVLVSGLAFGRKVQLLLDKLVYEEHELYVSEYVVQEFEKIVYKNGHPMQVNLLQF